MGDSPGAPLPAVVLDRPRNPANIGAVVRAMRNFAFTDLRLVNPASFDRDDLLRYAHRCEELVYGLTVYADLDQALADTAYVVGTAALVHPGRPYTRDVRGLAHSLATSARPGKAALLFGTEADGLDRHALDRCHLIASLPVNPDYPALNLAQSVLLFLYEIAGAYTAETPPPDDSAEPSATQADLERLVALSEATLAAAGYFRYPPATAMRRLRGILYRARLTRSEAAMLMGMARKLGNPPGDP